MRILNLSFLVLHYKTRSLSQICPFLFYTLAAAAAAAASGQENQGITIGWDDQDAEKVKIRNQESSAAGARKDNKSGKKRKFGGGGTRGALTPSRISLFCHSYCRSLLLLRCFLGFGFFCVFVVSARGDWGCKRLIFCGARCCSFCCSRWSVLSSLR